MELENLTLNIEQTIEIKAAPGDVFEGLIRRLSTDSQTPDGEKMPMVLERWPGGRWFRDLGNAQGHLWGFVQVIKPPTLLEITGPMFMSYPTAGHIQFRIKPIPGGAELTLHHQALGLIQEEHRQGVVPGWNAILNDVKTFSE